MIAKCSCQHCDGGIEFEADELAEENNVVSCPHCGAETKISTMEQIQPSIELPQTLVKTTEDEADEMKWCFKGAKLGDVDSMAHLGLCYAQGKKVPQNFTEAEKWLRKAAEKGDADAQYNLGCLYQLGQNLPQNTFEAFSWWLKAAERGHVIAQNNVGFLYEQGEIISQDYVEAHKWMSLAAGQGFEGAIDHANKMALKMTTAQRDESQHRIKAFTAIIPPHKSLENVTLIERFAKMGDLESQAILLAKENPAAAAELLRRVVGQEGISNSCIPNAGEIMELLEKKEELEKQIQEFGDFSPMRRAISSEVRREVWRRDEGRCVKCGSRERLEYDHIIPVVKGGSNTARNIELLCEVCNRAKSDSIK